MYDIEIVNMYRCTIRFPSTKLKIIFQSLISPSSDSDAAKSAVQPASSYNVKNKVGGVSAAVISSCPSPSGTLR